VRPEQVAGMRRKVENYKRFRELVNEWVDLAVERERAERVQEKYRRPNLAVAHRPRPRWPPKPLLGMERKR
jgi:hypothetical protein